MPLRNPSTSHAESHTVASHSDTTATGAEIETLTDGSEVSIHSHAGGGLADIPAWAADIRDNYALLAFVSGANSSSIASTDPLGLGMGASMDGSGSIASDFTRGGAIRLMTGSTGDSQTLAITGGTGASGDRNAHFATVLKSRATSSALKFQGWGFMGTDVVANWGGNEYLAMFRSATTGNLFAVTKDGSTEETTDLGSFHTLGTSATFEVFTTDDGATWKFEIGGTQRASHSTNIPPATGVMYTAVGIENNTTTSLIIEDIVIIYAYQDRN
jgi:hypothetical protein